MSRSVDTGILQRAHTLSAQASNISHSPSNPLPTLNSALGLHRQALDLYIQAASSPTVDPDTAKTLNLLVAQHKKLVKDLERRISIYTAKTPSTIPSLRRSATVPAPNTSNRDGEVGRNIGSPIKLPVGGVGLGGAVGAIASINPFHASSTRPEVAQRALPPFARRPSTSASNAIPPGTLNPSSPFATSTSTAQPLPTLSPLYSSASSEDPDPAESYITFGLGLGNGAGRGGKEVDPFSRFWGMLEECLDEVSRPIAFTSVPLTRKDDERTGERIKKGSRSKGKGKEKLDIVEDDAETISPTDSFYMISDTPPAGSKLERKPRSSSIKTPEELELENASLRLSLDALAIHTQKVEDENKAWNIRNEEREKVLRTVAAGVRKEAEKARLDTSILRSQLLGQSVLIDKPPSRRPQQATQAHHSTGTLPANPDERLDPTSTPVLRLRVKELEEEVKGLKAENVKQKGYIHKYKERFDKIKLNAKAKKEAREGKEG